ncbi:MAG: magnesium transporter [Rhodospirillaceae bacterium]|jgi:magnesium transporter|nr:magnesium transporter [Rhodospirillaceae bacterium]MBT3808429.1 magnesium transporter [Rhodospirillaceae bacterium]MBT3929605.1 magnesium transporter [Rhodospirillaceae bacterium]MBT4771894.1 magnesium transporter [Rhodospirillaceae bacterium]MBT5358477.1 magnesium transporter [Rhodospirillaceae bacterium]
MTHQTDMDEGTNGLETERSYGVDESLVRTCEIALSAGRIDELDGLIDGLHASDLADLLEALSSDSRRILFDHVRDRLDPELLTHLDDVVREDVLEQLEPAEVAAVITELDTDDAIDVFEDVAVADQASVLARLSPSDRALVEQALSYPEDSAGRLMQHELVTVPKDWSVGNSIDYMRARAADLPRDFYEIYVVDDDRHPVGTIPLSRLMRNQRDVRIDDIMLTDLRSAYVEMDQEEAALMFRQYALLSAPVVNERGQLVGVITADDIVHVIHEEAEEDILRLGGVREDDFYEAVLDTTRARFSWLLVNLGTAIIASLVIGLFDAAIEQVVALAILMPIVASMGGNAGTQTLTVAVRALAMKELTAANAARIMGKEVVVGGINGLLFALMIGLVAWLWFGEPVIGLIIGAAMMFNLLIAGFAGVTIPLALERMRIDPAVGSAVVLTTITDVVGFVSFLGLAAIVLL